ncbi:uncharacterized protein LOC135819735 isoform X2 [Sycon ciliatum]|uniref:uncharacterized protein LOC135819735 isoform X2 n=1 Tax=Sycon ciliatum TaxID=27933 RepID=UPI0031F6ED44
MGNNIVPAAAGNPFNSPEFIADIHPWLLTVDADTFRETAQQNQLLRTFDIVADLEDTLQREGRKAHNKKLIQVISTDELHGYERLCYVVAKMGYHTRVHQMLNQLPERNRPLIDLPSSGDMATTSVRRRTTSVRRRTRTGVDGGNGDSDGRSESQSVDGNEDCHGAEDCPGEEEGHGAEERNETAVEHETSPPAEPEAVRAQRRIPFLAMVAGLSVLIIAVISVYYGFSSPALPDLGRAEKLLKIRYSKANNIYSPILGASTVNTVDNIYINLVMLPKKNLSEEFENGFESSSDDMWRTEHAFTRASQEMQSVNLESLLNSTHHEQSPHPTGQTFGTIVTASAGCGKSFVFTRVAPIKWAAGELWPDKKLLVARELRFPDVHKATSLSKLLGLDGIGIEDSNAQQEICDHVRAHPESLVLILDGLDEVNLKDMSSFVYDVLFGEELQGIHLIVTSRPCADVFQLSVLPHFHQHIELMGFRADDVERYIHNVLSPEKAGALVAEVDRSAYLRGMMATPFMAQEVCMQYHFGLDAPQCMTDMFEQMIVQIINRKYARAYKQWNEVPVEAQLLVMEIGKFAFNMLVEKRMIFSDADLQKHSLSEHAYKLGLLVTGEESLSRDMFKQHRFSHLTTQEYLAAMYLARHPLHNVMSNSSIIRLVEILGAETAHLRTFWAMFCAQLTATQAEYLVNSLLTRRKVQKPEGEIVDFLFYSTPISNSMDLVQLPDLSAYFKQGKVERAYLQGLAFHSFAELVVHQKGVNTSLPSIRALLVSNQGVRFTMDQQPAEQRSIDMILHHHPQDVRKVTILVHFWIPTLIVYFPMSLAKCSGLRVLSINLINVPSALATVTSAVQHSARNLQELNLYWTPVSASLLTALSSCHRLQDLQLTYSSRMDTRVSALASAFSNLTALENFELESDCGLESDAVAEISRALHRSSKLSSVCFRDCGLTASVLPAFTTALQYWKRLRSLKLIHNNFSDTGSIVASRFFSAISKLPDLHGIGLYNCSLPESTGFAIATELYNISTMQFLTLSNNPSLGNKAVVAILHALSQCKKMFAVRLENCGLTAASLPAITTALQRWPKLTWLQLHDNDFSAVTAEQTNDFIAAANAHKKLTSLTLRKGGMPPSGRPAFNILMSDDSYRLVDSVDCLQE